MAEAVQQFGLHDEDVDGRPSTAASSTRSRSLTELREEVRVTPLDDPEQWPVYGSLISDAMRAVHELESAREEAARPTDTEPLRAPPTSGRWARLLGRGGRRAGLS